MQINISSQSNKHQSLLQCATCHEYFKPIHLIEHEKNRSGDCCYYYECILRMNEERMDFLYDSSSENNNDISDEKEQESVMGTDANYKKQEITMRKKSKRTYKRKKKVKPDKSLNTMKIQSNISELRDNYDDEIQLFDIEFNKWMNNYQVNEKFKNIMTIMSVPKHATDQIAVKLIDFICDC